MFADGAALIMVAGGGGGAGQYTAGAPGSTQSQGTTTGDASGGVGGTGGQAGHTNYDLSTGYTFPGGGGGEGILSVGGSSTGNATLFGDIGVGGGNPVPADYLATGATGLGGSGRLAGGSGTVGEGAGGGGGGYSGGAGGDALNYYQFPSFYESGRGGGGGGSYNLNSDSIGIIPNSNPGAGYVLLSFDYDTITGPPGGGTGVGGGLNIPPAVPEPATWGLMLLGIGTLGARLRARRAAGLLARA